VGRQGLLLKHPNTALFLREGVVVDDLSLALRLPPARPKTSLVFQVAQHWLEGSACRRMPCGNVV
jgi:hypothetical protein